MKKRIGPIAIVALVFAAYFAVNFTVKSIRNRPAPTPRLMLTNKQEMVKYGMEFGPDSDLGKIVKIHEVPGVPNGFVLHVAEVAVQYDSVTYHKIVFFSGSYEYKVGDSVTVHMVNLTTVTGSKYIPFILPVTKQLATVTE